LPRQRLSPKRPVQPDADWLSTLSLASGWPNFDETISFRDLGFPLDPFYARESPDGAILRGFNEEDAEIARRFRNRKCPEDETSYYTRVKHFEEVQRGREYIPPNEFYEIMRKKALRAEDDERQSRIERAQSMFLMHAMGELKGHFLGWKLLAAKQRRVKRFLIRRMFDTKRSILEAWYDIAQKYKRAKYLMSRHMANHQQKAFLGWKEYVTKNLKVKRLMMGHMAKLEQRTFRAWADYTGKGKFVREKIGKHLIGAKRERFKRWAKYTETSLKIKRLVGKHFVGMLRSVFVAWFVWTEKSIKAKRMFAGHLLGLQKMVFQAWRGVTDEWKREREAKRLWLGHQNPEDFFLQGFMEVPKHKVQQLPRNYNSPASTWRISF